MPSSTKNHSLVHDARRPLSLGAFSLAAFVIVFSPLVASAGTIVAFTPVPTSLGLPEFNYLAGPAQLVAGIGSTSNNDGNLATSLQNPPGLQLDTPVSVGDGYGSNSFGRQFNANGSTTFYDTTFSLAGLIAAAPASSTPSPPLGVIDQQVLGAGTFSIYQSAPVGVGPLLLSGSLINAVLYGIDGTASGGTLSSTVTYTGGSIYNFLLANGGTLTGNMTFNLNLFAGSSFGIGGDGNILPFSANGQGQFDTPTVPEPTTLVLFVLGALWLLLARYRRRAA